MINKMDRTLLLTALSFVQVNNYIGAKTNSQTLINFDWYFPHLYHVPEKLQKTFNVPVFLHHINVRKRVYTFPHLCELKIEKPRQNELARVFFTFKRY